jgi:hypothetical protein
MKRYYKDQQIFDFLAFLHSWPAFPMPAILALCSIVVGESEA